MNTDTNQIALVKRKPNWAVIKTAYLNGEGSFRDLAQQFNVSFHTFAKRAKREDWTGQMARLCDAVATTAMEMATERGKELGMTAGDFVERSIRETERWLNRIEALASEGKLTPDTAQKLVNSWRSTLAAGREAFGLDTEAPAPRLVNHGTLSINLNAPQPVTVTTISEIDATE